MTERRHAMRYQRRQREAACNRAERAEEFPPRRDWSADDEAFVRKHYDARGPVWCGVRLNRSTDAVKWHVMKMRARDELAAFARQYLGTPSLRA